MAVAFTLNKFYSKNKFCYTKFIRRGFAALKKLVFVERFYIIDDLFQKRDIVHNFKEKTIDVFGDVIVCNLVPDCADVQQIVGIVDDIEFL